MSLVSRLRGAKSPAWAMAGLLFFAPALQAVEAAPPGRSVASPSAEMAPAKDLEALKTRLAEVERSAASEREAQARRLSEAALGLDKLKAAQESEAKSQALLQRSVEGLISSLSGLEQGLQDLKSASSKAQVKNTDQDERLESMAKDLEAMRLSLSTEKDRLAAGLKEIAATRVSMDERSAKLASLSELLGVIKKDVDSNNEELVELRQELKAAAAKPNTAEGWWAEITAWKPMAVLAVGLGAVALGVAAFKQ